MVWLLKRLFGIQKKVYRWRAISTDGQLVAVRTYLDFHIELYQLKDKGFSTVSYFEVWRKQGLGQIYWIEKQQEEYVVQYYSFPLPR